MKNLKYKIDSVIGILFGVGCTSYGIYGISVLGEINGIFPLLSGMACTIAGIVLWNAAS